MPSAQSPQRIAKLLARAGVASRREIERMIAEGRIAHDGVTLDTPATLLSSLRGVTVDGVPVQEPAPARLYRFHKPVGALTAERDPGGRPTIYDRLPAGLPRLVPVGRLDLNTEGLLLLTTDGGLKRQLELPATGIPRRYRARAYGQVSQAQLEELIHGVEIEGVRYGSINANLERRTGANVWIELSLAEGKNREVRRVLEHLGLRVGRLIRTAYGPFALGDLAVGELAEVRQHDLVAFRQALHNGRGAVEALPVIAEGAPARRIAPRAVRPASPARPKATSAARPHVDAARPGPAAPSRAPASSDPAATPRRERPKRKAGWAKAKPRTGGKRRPTPPRA